MGSIADEQSLKILIALALEEDGVAADLTAEALVAQNARLRAEVVARAPGVIAGSFLMAGDGPLLKHAHPAIAGTALVAEGEAVEAGAVIGVLEGSARSVLAFERTLLNFLQRLSGIATATAACVAEVEGVGRGVTRIQETRKTCPGWRVLDKHAVRVGGGLNHRMGLHDAVLVKENHLASTPAKQGPQAIREASEILRPLAEEGRTIEIEVESPEELAAALEAGVAHVIMLDEFPLEEVRRAVETRDRLAPKVLLEASGGLGPGRLAALAQAGVDRISLGALTHSVKALDLALDAQWLTPGKPT